MSYAERITLKSRRELDQMRTVGQHTGEILMALREKAKPGVTTGELNDFAGKELKRRGLNSPFLNYSPGGFPPIPRCSAHRSTTRLFTESRGRGNSRRVT